MELNIVITSPSLKNRLILDYKNKITNPKNIVISVNGDIDTNLLIEKFGNILSDKKQAEFKYNNYKVTKLSSKKIISKTIPELTTAWLFLGWQTSGISDTKDFVTLKIINTITNSIIKNNPKVLFLPAKLKRPKKV